MIASSFLSKSLGLLHVVLLPSILDAGLARVSMQHDAVIAAFRKPSLHYMNEFTTQHVAMLTHAQARPAEFKSCMLEHCAQTQRLYFSIEMRRFSMLLHQDSGNCA
eukprot:3261900-Amphidinium_carterae.1